MRRRPVLLLALTLGLTAGCGSPGEEESLEMPTDQEEREEAVVATCRDFYEGQGTSLADRAESARDALSGGQVTDAAAFTEITALEQSLRELADEAHVEVVSVIAEIAAPLTAAVAAVDDAGDQDVPEGEQPPFPELAEIDVAEAADAQERLRETCAEAGYEPG